MESIEIIKKEGLERSVTDYLICEIARLVDAGYSEEAAEKAICGALPYIVFRHGN